MIQRLLFGAAIIAVLLAAVRYSKREACRRRNQSIAAVELLGFRAVRLHSTAWDYCDTFTSGSAFAARDGANTVRGTVCCTTTLCYVRDFRIEEMP